MELKNTLLMPKTNFEMRGNLINKEPNMLKNWHETDLYNLMNSNREGCEEYLLHDGPPYANGNMHCGHMLNRLLKDFVVRQKNMAGYKTPFIFGWDTHGLPIENEVTKSGVNRKTTPISEFRNKCRDYAIKQVNIQKEQIRRLGVIGDYDNPYLTLDKQYEAKQINTFKKMALNGLIFKGLKPVYWSPSSESALAESEIEYQDVESYSIYVGFNVKDGKGLLSNDTSVLIWTTTPWTLPANLAISVNPSFEYGVYSSSRGKFLLLKEFKEKMEEVLETALVLEKEIKGKQLEFVTTTHPFIDRESVIILGDHVTNEAGTGCVHTAPGHGADDYNVCSKYKIKPYCPVDSKGVMMEEAGPRLAGMFYEKANEEVINMLEENNSLLSCTKFTHSYPHDWRTKKPLIFRATPQWFCSIEPIRNKLLNAITTIKWYPAWGETRMINMIRERADWCISRQRAWGVPIPIIYCEDNTPIMDEVVFDHIEQLISEHGSNIWYLKEAKELLPEGYTNAKSPNGLFTKEVDIMDVWFDSGSSFNGVIDQRGLKYPSDLYLEGNDQYRGWFNSSLILSVATNDVPSFKACVTHGFVVDETWQKMSKSRGNGIDPSKVANQYGADILRLWTASIDYQQDSRISENIILQVVEVYRKIRNTFKFMLGNISEFDVNNDLVNEYSLVDNFILARLEEVKNGVINAYNKFDFAGVTSLITNFLSSDLSSLYLDIKKDVFYCEAKSSLRRRQVVSVIYKIVDVLMRLLTPILPFTMEEVNNNITFKTKENPLLLDFPIISNEFSKDTISNYRSLLKTRDFVLKTLEVLRKDGVIGSSQEASVQLTVEDVNVYEMLKNVPEDELRRIFVVSKIELNKGKDSCSAERNNEHKCPRCWNYVNELKQVEDVCVCPRCYEVLKNV